MTLLHSWGVPASSLGADHDWCIDHLGWFLYGPKTSGAWTFSVSLLAPTPGSPTPKQRPTVFQGVGAPSPELGASGDWYIDTDINIVYGPKVR